MSDATSAGGEPWAQLGISASVSPTAEQADLLAGVVLDVILDSELYPPGALITAREAAACVVQLEPHVAGTRVLVRAVPGIDIHAPREFLNAALRAALEVHGTHRASEHLPHPPASPKWVRS